MAIVGGLALLLGACGAGEDFLADSGPALDWVGEASAPVVIETTTTTMPLLVDLASLNWANDDLALGEPDASPTEVTARIYGSSEQTDRFVQTAAVDIATVLPGIDVPGRVPARVRHVTSQLVFDPIARRLSNDPAAAFGFWSVEPYSQSRSVGQQGVLMVSLDADAESQVPDAMSVCTRFEGRGTCEPTDVDGVPAWWLSDGSGSTLVWYASPHRYELEMRGDREFVEDVAASFVPLVNVLAQRESGA